MLVTYPQGFILLCTIKVKSKHETVVCDHDEDAIKSVATGGIEKIISIPHC